MALALPHGRTALAQQLNRSIFRIAASTAHPPLPRTLLSGLQRTQRHFSASPRPQVQYTRFSNDHHHPHRQLNRDKVVKILIFVTAAGGVYVVAHLEQVPETGRWRFMNTSPELEADLGKSSYEALLSEFRGKILPPNHPIARQVHRVVSDLLEASDLGTLRSSSPRTRSAAHDDLWSDDPFAFSSSHDPPNRKEWNLLVVDDPKIVNAQADFSNIVVFTGILPICKNEAGLAAVVGHEIGHVVARHASERISSYTLLTLFAFLLNAFGLDFNIARILNSLVFQLPNSRTQELEADTLGMRIAAKACYDPQSAVEMHRRLAGASESGGLSSIEFLRTHPIPERRIKHLEELVPEAHEIQAANPRCAGVRESIEQFFGGITRWG